MRSEVAVGGWSRSGLDERRDWDTENWYRAFSQQRNFTAVTCTTVIPQYMLLEGGYKVSYHPGELEVD